MATKYWCGITTPWTTTASKWGNFAPGIVFSGSRTATTLTVTTVYSGSITPGAVGTGPVLYNVGVAAGTITSQIFPLIGNEVAGGAGRYTTSLSGSIAGPIELYTFLANQVSATVPGATDDVIFSSVSAPSPTVAAVVTLSFLSLTIQSASTGNYTFAGTNPMTCAGNFTLAPGTFWTQSGANLTFTSAGAVITTNGSIVRSNIVVAAATANISLADNFNGTGTLTHTGGTITLNSFNWNCATYTASGSTIKTLAFGATGTVTAIANGGSLVSVSSTFAQISFTGNPQFIFSSANGTNRTFAFTSTTWGGPNPPYIPALKVNPGSTDVVTLSLPVLTGYSNIIGIDCTGFLGTFVFGTANTTVYMTKDLVLPASLNTNGNSFDIGTYTSGNSGKLQINSPTTSVALAGTRTQVGDLVLLQLTGNGTVNLNNTGTVAVSQTFNVPTTNFVGPMTATFAGGCNMSAGTSTGTVSITADRFSVAYCDFSANTTVTATGANGDVFVYGGTVPNAFTVNITGIDVGPSFAKYIYGAPNTTAGANFKIACAGAVKFNNGFDDTGLTAKSIDMTGYTGTDLSGTVSTIIEDSLTIPSAIYANMSVVTRGGGNFVLNAPTARLQLLTIDSGTTVSLSTTANIDYIVVNSGNTFNAGDTVINNIYGVTAITGSTVNLQSSTWYLQFNSEFTMQSGVVFNAGTSTINLLGDARLSSPGYSFNNVVLGGTGTRIHYISAAFINTISNSVSPMNAYFNTDCVFTNFNLNGTAGNLVTVKASPTGTQRTLTKPSAWNVGANSTDGGNNVGLAFVAGNNNYLNMSYISGVNSANNQGNFFLLF